MSNNECKYTERIAKFIDVFLSTRGGFAPGVPQEMSGGPPDEYGWSPWHPIDSPITKEYVASLEQSIGARLPPLFCRYLTYKCLLMTRFGILSLPEIRCDRPSEKFRLFVDLIERQPYWRANGYIPFADDGDDYGILAFDTNRRSADGDCPVMYVAPEAMGQPGYRGVQKWNNFSHLLDDVQASLLSYKK